MSTYIVDDATIARILANLASHADYYQYFFPKEESSKKITLVDLSDMAKQLMAMNREAVQYHYPKETVPHEEFKFSREYPKGYTTSLRQSLQTLACYLYQCEEGDVPNLPLFKRLTLLKHKLGYDCLTKREERFGDHENLTWG